MTYLVVLTEEPSFILKDVRSIFEDEHGVKFVNNRDEILLFVSHSQLLHFVKE